MEYIYIYCLTNHNKHYIISLSCTDNKGCMYAKKNTNITSALLIKFIRNMTILLPAILQFCFEKYSSSPFYFMIMLIAWTLSCG